MPSVEMVELFKAELELCKVGPGEKVAILSSGEVRADYAQAFLLASQMLGADAFHLNMPPAPPAGARYEVGKTPLHSDSPAMGALKQADLLIDLIGLLFSHEQNEITATGTRMLMVLEPFSVLQQLFPTKDQRRRVEIAGKMMENAKVMHITSPHGTDITYELQQYPVLTEYGYTDTPGRWDHFPSGFLLTQGADKKINGKVVIMPGDILNAFRKYVQTPLTMIVEEGMVVDIQGDGMDATLVKTYIESFKDPRAYAVSHIGWGMNEKADWHHFAETRELDHEIGVHALAFYGNVLFSLGPNSEVGGDNDTKCHLDIPLRDCSLTLDGVQIVKDGDIVPEELRAAS